MTDATFELNTGIGNSSFTTSKIKGFLESIILISDEQVSLEIDSENGYTLFKRLNHVGINLFMVRYPTESPLGLTYTDHVDKLYLNDKLILTINGKPNKNIKIILRYS